MHQPRPEVEPPYARKTESPMTGAGWHSYLPPGEKVRGRLSGGPQKDPLKTK